MKRSFLELINKYAVLTIIIIALLTAFFFYHTLFLTLDADYTGLLAPDAANSTYQGGVKGGLRAEVPKEEILKEEEAEENEYSTTYMLLIESPSLYTAKSLTLISQTLAE